LYLKTHSYGEFVFDWSWAQAYHRHGLAYYPKLVSAIPYTPATGQRLLVAAGVDPQPVIQAMLDQVAAEAAGAGCSSVHWLFTTAGETRALVGRGYLRRLGCQFHWHNPGYRDFADFLEVLNAKRRKNIRRERRLAGASGLEVVLLPGHEVSDGQWRAFHGFYCDTFRRLGGWPTLTLGFFRDIAATLGEQILLVLARDGRREVAAAISYASRTTLYGRHWGCLKEHDSLHFEVCYYQGIDHCIRRGLTRFEPGAQGEHKIWRGFLPAVTESAHWLAHPGFRQAVDDFLRRETPAVLEYARALGQHSPYREEAPAP
ncbi:MAG: GNAT family N-acetyltransferase, partial [Pseudomonadota bacterium]|nr:GNAT family N-acetyltransferase [Pseudomonadota bacterium]